MSFDISNEKHTSGRNAEKDFLSTYNMDDYEKPSVAADIAVFSMFAKETESHRKDAEQKLHILLIKRGEFPYKDRWALPGGFLRNYETIEECAIREIREETNLKPVALLPIGTFSDTYRDPRGRIISIAFASIVNAKDIKIMGGSDASSAEWFEVDFKYDELGELEIRLSSDSEVLCAKLKTFQSRFGISKFNVVENKDIAFDHAKIIATALSTIQKEAEDYMIAFDFLPEKFTLTEFQKVQETLMGISLLTANFRRKTADLVEETESYTEGAGHRPARLYRKKRKPHSF